MSEPQPDASLQFVDVQGETLIKSPGSINGESFSIKNLVDCSIFLLDYTSEVEVTDCRNCQIFIGPVDGPAIFDGNTNCNVAVACQQFQAKSCRECSFGLYCATPPSLSSCSGIVLGCWAGAYPGLVAQFRSANLDPTKNQWANVYDASAIDGSQPNYTLSSDIVSWEVPVEGAEGPAENPVPVSAPPITSSAPEDDFSAMISGGTAIPSHQQQTAVPSENGGLAPFPLHTSAGVQSNNTQAETDAHARLQSRLASQAKEEADKKSEVQSRAAQFLEEFYAQRNAAKEARITTSREDLRRRAPSADQAGPKGDTVWERAVSLIDFNMARPNGTDLSRFKAVLLACQERSSR